MSGRAELWREADVPMHLRLIDGDLDEHEADIKATRRALEQLGTALRSEMKEGFAQCHSNDAGTKKLLVSLLVSILLLAVAATLTVLTATGGTG